MRSGKGGVGRWRGNRKRRRCSWRDRRGGGGWGMGGRKWDKENEEEDTPK